MASTNKTTNLELNNWIGGDRSQREDFNSDNEKIDTWAGGVNSQLKDMAQDSYPIVEATGTNAYVGASTRIKSVGKGARCTLFVGTDATGNCSLNLNDSGAVAIKDSNGNVVTNLKSNIPYNLCHNGSDFILQGKGGGGNLIAKYLLSGYYGEGDNGRVDGAMVNRGAPTTTLNCGGTYNIAEGYYSGGKVTANSLASQTPANATAEDITNGKTAWINGKKITGNATIQSLGGIKPILSGKVSITQKGIDYGVTINLPSECANKVILILLKNTDKGEYSNTYSFVNNGKNNYDCNFSGYDVVARNTSTSTINFYIYSGISSINISYKVILFDDISF